MTKQYRAKFTDSSGKIFLVDEVCQTEAGLTVHYTKEATGEKYNCLLEAFSQRFTEIEND